MRRNDSAIADNLSIIIPAQAGIQENFEQTSHKRMRRKCSVRQHFR